MRNLLRIIAFFDRHWLAFLAYCVGWAACGCILSNVDGIRSTDAMTIILFAPCVLLIGFIVAAQIVVHFADDDLVEELL